jgi:hypothetical protein
MRERLGASRPAMAPLLPERECGLGQVSLLLS